MDQSHPSRPSWFKTDCTEAHDDHEEEAFRESETPAQPLLLFTMTGFPGPDNELDCNQWIADF
jgi:hypothetical protein